MAKLKILFNAVDSEATGSQRVLHPLKGLADAEQAEIQVLNTEDIRSQLKWANLMVLQCLVGDQQVEMLKKVKEKNIPIVIDYDDNFAALPPNVLKRLSLTKEQAAKNWKEYLNLASLVTTPCNALAEKIRQVSKAKVEVLPNCLTNDEYYSAKNYQPIEDGSVRILYSCSDTHIKDFKWIGPILKKIGEWYPEVIIASQGNLNFTFNFPTYTGRAEHHLNAPYNGYHQKLREINPHICIGPLLPEEHAICRSHIKYLQTSSVKAAFLGSDLAPYNETVVHGKNGLLASNRLTWFWNLRKLVKNPEYRKNMAQEAYSEAGNWLYPDHISKWKKIYDTLVS